VASIQWPETHDLARSRLLARLDNVRVGRHQISIPLDGPPAFWLSRLTRVLEVAVEIEGAPVPA
jgi:hypothetical protein